MNTILVTISSTAPTKAPGCPGHPPAQDRRSVSFVQYWCEEVVSWCVGALAVGDMVTSAETLN